MSARIIPRPTTGVPTTAEQVFEWLRFLCLNSSGRGLGGHELASCSELLMGLAQHSEVFTSSTLEGTAQRVREWLRGWYEAAIANPSLVVAPKAKLHLLGLTPESIGECPARRRHLAARVIGTPIDTFRRRDEHLLLADVADDIWAGCSCDR